MCELWIKNTNEEVFISITIYLVWSEDVFKHVKQFGPILLIYRYSE